MVIQDLGWEIHQYPPYSLDLAPTAYHLFRSFENASSEISFHNNVKLRNCLES
ncbi:hypothetical protein WH47_12004 [Habropoda laboriosa]|uniref:Histone-lysine N-methyltransferase SETMAR n=1 Tax=Habropoda laboriosa TaxID=597456 RepID=A0A0L7R110_9HYME|nr:hypothetical protein WH47_12004 [Habropoda laboriosa]